MCLVVICIYNKKHYKRYFTILCFKKLTLIYVLCKLYELYKLYELCNYMNYVFSQNHLK